MDRTPKRASSVGPGRPQSIRKCHELSCSASSSKKTTPGVILDVPSSTETSPVRPSRPVVYLNDLNQSNRSSSVHNYSTQSSQIKVLEDWRPLEKVNPIIAYFGSPGRTPMRSKENTSHIVYQQRQVDFDVSDSEDKTPTPPRDPERTLQEDLFKTPTNSQSQGLNIFEEVRKSLDRTELMLKRCNTPKNENQLSTGNQSHQVNPLFNSDLPGSINAPITHQSFHIHQSFSTNLDGSMETSFKAPSGDLKTSYLRKLKELFKQKSDLLLEDIKEAQICYNDVLLAQLRQKRSAKLEECKRLMENFKQDCKDGKISEEKVHKMIKDTDSQIKVLGKKFLIMVEEGKRRNRILDARIENLKHDDQVEHARREQRDVATSPLFQNQVFSNESNQKLRPNGDKVGSREEVEIVDSARSTQYDIQSLVLDHDPTLRPISVSSVEPLSDVLVPPTPVESSPSSVFEDLPSAKSSESVESPKSADTQSSSSTLHAPIEPENVSLDSVIIEEPLVEPEVIQAHSPEQFNLQEEEEVVEETIQPPSVKSASPSVFEELLSDRSEVEYESPKTSEPEPSVVVEPDSVISEVVQPQSVFSELAGSELVISEAEPEAVVFEGVEHEIRERSVEREVSERPRRRSSIPRLNLRSNSSSPVKQITPTGSQKSKIPRATSSSPDKPLVQQSSLESSSVQEELPSAKSTVESESTETSETQASSSTVAPNQSSRTTSDSTETEGPVVASESVSGDSAAPSVQEQGSNGHSSISEDIVTALDSITTPTPPFSGRSIHSQSDSAIFSPHLHPKYKSKSGLDWSFTKYPKHGLSYDVEMTQSINSSRADSLVYRGELSAKNSELVELLELKIWEDTSDDQKMAVWWTDERADILIEYFVQNFYQKYIKKHTNQILSLQPFRYDEVKVPYDSFDKIVNDEDIQDQLLSTATVVAYFLNQAVQDMKTEGMRSTRLFDVFKDGSGSTLMEYVRHKIKTTTCFYPNGPQRQYYDMTSFERRIHCQEVSGKFKLEFMTRRIQKYASPQPPVSYPQSQRSNKITYPLTAAQIASINHSHSATSITNEHSPSSSPTLFEEEVFDFENPLNESLVTCKTAFSNVPTEFYTPNTTMANASFTSIDLDLTPDVYQNTVMPKKGKCNCKSLNKKHSVKCKLAKKITMYGKKIRREYREKKAKLKPEMVKLMKKSGKIPEEFDSTFKYQL